MYRLVKIKIQNFLSIKDIEYIFRQGETVLVQGINLTDTSQKSNGSGKSAFQAAIDFVLTNSCARSVASDKDLIRTGEEGSLIRLELENTLYRSVITIQRTLSQKNSSTLKIWEEGSSTEDDPIKFSTIPEGNKLLATMLGVSSKDIHNYFLPNELTYTSFFKSSDNDIKDLISRFSKTDVLNPTFTFVQEDSETKSKELSEAKSSCTVFETAANIYQIEIETEEKRDFEQEKKDEIFLIEQSITSKQSLIIQKKQNQQELVSRLDGLKVELEVLSTNIGSISSSIEELTASADRSSFFTEVSESRREIILQRGTEVVSQKQWSVLLNEMDSSLSSVNNLLSGQITCPKCSHKFTLKSEKSIEELEQEKIEYEKQIDHTSKLIEEVQIKIASFDQNLDEVSLLEKEVIDEVNLIRNEIRTLSSTLSQYQRDLKLDQDKQKSYNDAILQHDSSINILSNEILSLQNSIELIKSREKDLVRLQELKSKKKLAQDSFELKMKEVEALEKELFEIDSWTNRFKSFKSYLANKQLRAITGYTNKYLRDFGTDIEVNIEGFKQLSSGETREKITAYVYRNGKVRSYGSFSKGERGKIDYAVILALQTLINITSTTGGIDLLFPDEVIEGMDSLGLSSLLKSLSKTKKTNLLTTHMIESLQYSNLLTFVKEDNITKIQ